MGRMRTPGGKTRGIEVLHGALDAFEHLARVLAPAHHYDAFDVLRFPNPARKCRFAASRSRSSRRPISRINTGAPLLALRTMFSMSVVEFTSPTPRTTIDCWWLSTRAPPAFWLLARTAAGDLRDRHVVLLELERVDFDLILLEQAAKGFDVAHAIFLEEARRNHPVLQLAQFHGIVARGLRPRSGITPPPA